VIAGGLVAGGRWLLDALLPPHCLTCDEPVEAQGSQCGECFTSLGFVTAPLCDRCGVPLPHVGAGIPAPLPGRLPNPLAAPLTAPLAAPLAAPMAVPEPSRHATTAGALWCPRCVARPPEFARARAALRYDAGTARLILPFKHADRTEFARPLARHMARAGAALLETADLLAPVPLHPRRLFSRRYNQAALLASILARGLEKKYAPALLRRRVATPPLGEQGAQSRAATVADVFALGHGAAARIAGRRVLLIDDVLTSGATAGSCAMVLLAAGAARVEVLAAARVPDPRLESGDA